MKHLNNTLWLHYKFTTNAYHGFMSTTDSSHSVVPICLLHYSCSNHYTWTLSSLQCCLLFNNFSVTGDLLRYKTPLLTIFIMFFMLFSLNYHSFFILSQLITNKKQFSSLLPQIIQHKHRVVPHNGFTFTIWICRQRITILIYGHLSLGSTKNKRQNS